ncbi:MAG: NAD(P)/FAD-dependent oxidoreductase [Candidatus Hydrogenedentes bacterium]|nr:NAD(P)/FAD-dependent oxidoreductase [Candidatus Hydrogenedentota bacterium]
MGAISTDTIIVGAGPSGLAIAACLMRANVPHIVVERSQHVGNAWRNHYDRLHLHTVKRFSNLPHYAFPGEVEKYPSRQAVVDYFNAYAKHFNIQPHLGEDVTAIKKMNGAWETRTSQNEYHSERVVVASGYNRRPLIPKWPDREAFQGAVYHSAEYRDGDAYRGKRVLVVGIGNTGGEIAIDLHEHGAAAVHICVRSPINVILRDYLGTPAQVTGITLSKLPKKLRYFVSKHLAHLSIGDLSRYGLQWPEFGPVESVERFGRVALIDVGTLDLIKNGAITVKPGISRFTKEGVAFTDGQEHSYDAVILATGYKPRLDEFLEDAHELTDEAGYPIPPAGESARTGLYFLGFDNPPTGLLRQIAIDAQRIAKKIARDYTTTGGRAYPRAEYANRE